MKRKLVVSVIIAVHLYVCVAAVRPLSALAQGEQKAVRSVNDGIYTLAQARHGESMFGTHCSVCHEPGDFRGSSFIDEWRGPLDALFNKIRTAMPQDNPGGLSSQVYADIVAYVLNLNGYPAGAEVLEGTADAIHRVQFDSAATPEPRAAGAH